VSYQIAITPGEPAGIGIDLCIQLAQEYFASLYNKQIYPVIIADPELLLQRAELLGQAITIHTNAHEFTSYAGQGGHILVHPISLATKCQAGVLNPRNAPYVLESINYAVSGCLNKQFAALVTGPVHKANIIHSGTAFTGHTEYLQQLTGVEKVVMSFYCQQFLLALVTTHLPLSQVSKHITHANIQRTLSIVNKSYAQLFGIEQPHIKVCGLNPHAGEDGCLGGEEQEIINPVITQLQEKGCNITGCVPADTAFLPQNLVDTDVIVAMYHDQGLAVLKHMAFADAVNLTLGLPFIRTSVDHGTALELAGSGNISSQNMRCAVELAIKLLPRI
jgi:4-hydroxythreonine-4-phosphate dehydrogenase